MAQATKRNQVCDLYIGYCTLKYKYSSNICAPLQRCVPVQGLQSLLTWKGGTTITNAILMLTSQTWRKFATCTLWHIHITTVHWYYNFWSWKNKGLYYRHFTEIITTGTITCFVCDFNQRFGGKKPQFSLHELFTIKSCASMLHWASYFSKRSQQTRFCQSQDSRRKQQTSWTVLSS